MRFPRILAKNLRVLLRSKESFFIIVFGPLLIILLVSFAFTSSQEVTIELGYNAPTQTPLVDQVVANINNQSGFVARAFPDAASCHEGVARGELLACMLFPDDFTIAENRTNLLRLLVDSSRVNLVYEIRDQLTSTLQLQRSELSKDLTEQILVSLATAENQLRQEMGDLSAGGESAETISTAVGGARETLGTVEFSMPEVDIRQVRNAAGAVESDANALREQSILLIATAEEILSDYDAQCSGCSNSTLEQIKDYEVQLEDYRSEIEGIYNDTPEKLFELYSVLDQADASIEAVEEQFEIAALNNEMVMGDLEQVRSDLASLRGRLDSVRTDLDGVLTDFASLPIRTTEQVVNPIATKIETVTPEVEQEEILFPYLLMLVVMFISLLLPSMLVVMEKTSRARFRNFTTPTRDGFLVVSTFITTLLILCLQAIVILSLAYVFGFLPPSFLEVGCILASSSLIIFLAICLFSLIGMLLGFLSSTTEATTIASISVGSVLLFLSNLVFPLEKLAIGELVRFNPYVVSSEMLKQSILYAAPISQMLVPILANVGAICLLFLLVLGVERLVKHRFFVRRSTRFLQAQQREQVVPLRIGSRSVIGVESLHDAIADLTQGEYEEYARGVRNEIVGWVRAELKDARLAKRLEGASKERALKLLASAVRHSKRGR